MVLVDGTNKGGISIGNISSSTSPASPIPTSLTSVTRETFIFGGVLASSRSEHLDKNRQTQKNWSSSPGYKAVSHLGVEEEGCVLHPGECVIQGHVAQEQVKANEVEV